MGASSESIISFLLNLFKINCFDFSFSCIRKYAECAGGKATERVRLLDERSDGSSVTREGGRLGCGASLALRFYL